MQDPIRNTVDYLFRTFDRNGDGFITPDEFKMYIDSTSAANKVDLMRAFQHNDINKDGRITKEEWYQILVSAWGPKAPSGPVTPPPVPAGPPQNPNQPPYNPNQPPYNPNQQPNQKIFLDLAC